ncbi:MAG TPA: thiamine biosynthesis protein ThiS [Oceanithermus profundus]|uniref:Thiamine biosynthesis protein ThiS n=1 Tax=Oceanithermus profundus TaxID=187137 RepID=A0A7C4VBW0_9DEIN|nr:thiamine biosynthesis protein ThiS [Oceanithermus profundus]
MKVILRTPHKEERELEGPLTVRELLERLDVDPEGVIVARGRELLTPDAVVADDDEVEVIRAISGGGA